MSDPSPSSARRAGSGDPSPSRAERVRAALLVHARHPLAPFGVLVAAYLVLRAGAFYAVMPRAFPDTRSYLEVASHPVWSTDFLAGARSWTLPLVWKLVPDSDVWRTRAQFGISVVCWLALAGAMAQSVRGRSYRVAVFAVVLVFSMSLSVIQFDTLLISESISISLTALLLAAWLWVLRAPSRLGFGAVLVTTFFWVFTRDSNAFLALMTIPFIGLWIWRPGPAGRLGPIVLAAGTAVIFALSLAATSTEDAQLRRAERPMLHVVGTRVMANPNAVKFFMDQGMPEPTPLAVANRKRLAGLGEGLPSDPETDVFLDWIARHGRSTLAKYLVRHPAGALRATFQARARIINSFSQGYKSRDGRKILPEPVAALAYPRDFQSVFFWLVLAMFLAAVAWVVAGASRLWWVPVIGLLVQIPHAALVYHGDTLEIPRHATLVSVMTRLSILLLVLLAIDGLLERRRAARSTDVRLSTP